MSGQSQSSQKGGSGMQQPYQPYGYQPGGYGGGMTPYSPSPAQQGSFYSLGGSMRPPMDTGPQFGSPYTGAQIMGGGNPSQWQGLTQAPLAQDTSGIPSLTGAQIMAGGNPYAGTQYAQPAGNATMGNIYGYSGSQGGNPIARTMDIGSTFASPMTGANLAANNYGNAPGQNGLVNTNGQFGFGNGSTAQLAPGTAAMLGYTRQGNNWVNSQGQVVGTV